MANEAPTVVWFGNEDMRSLLVPIDNLIPHPRNPRQHDVEAIKKSLDAFGQQPPVLALVREYEGLPAGTIVAGHGRVKAARELGWSHVAVVKSDLTGDEIERYLLADNRTGDLGSYDDEKLIEILNELAQASLLDGTGYSDDDLAAMIADANAVSTEPGDELDRMVLEADAEPPRLDELNRAPVPFTIPLALEPEQRRQFVGWLRMLNREWDVESPSEVLYRSVKEAALRVHASDSGGDEPT